MARKEQPIWHCFVAGGLGDMTATLFSHPADVLKVRLQLRGEGSNKRPNSARDLFRAARQLTLVEGVSKGLYSGISASLLRQALFSNLRHGLSAMLDKRVAELNTGMPASARRLVTSLSAGCLSAVVANPADVVLVRMQADGHWPEQQRRGYRHAFHGIARVVRDEGLSTLWRGCTPTVLRAALVTGAQITTYAEARDAARRNGIADGLFSQVLCAACSATVACLATSPVDVVKTRLMNMQSAHGCHYSGPLDCLWRTVSIEGPMGLYRGLSATFLRLWPHTVILWLAQERYLAVLRAS